MHAITTVSRNILTEAAMQITFFLSGMFLFEVLVCALADNKFFRFIEDGDLEGYTCPADQTIDDVEDTGSLVQCALKCSEISTCHGVFRQPENMRCVGCQDKFLTPARAESHTGSQYYRRETYRVVEVEKTWNEAKKHCEDLGGHLADIKSEEEEMFIENYVISAYTEQMWLGATDVESESNFLWQDGTSVGYVKWAPTEPNNFDWSAYINEHCLQIRIQDEEWKWGDAACQKSLLSLCEFQ